jgi:hypothetical protein
MCVSEEKHISSGSFVEFDYSATEALNNTEH